MISESNFKEWIKKLAVRPGCPSQYIYSACDRKGDIPFLMYRFFLDPDKIEILTAPYNENVQQSILKALDRIVAFGECDEYRDTITAMKL